MIDLNPGQEEGTSRLIPIVADTIQGNRHRIEKLKIASIIPRLCHRWESLSLKERYQRLIILTHIAPSVTTASVILTETNSASILSNTTRENLKQCKSLTALLMHQIIYLQSSKCYKTQFLRHFKISMTVLLFSKEFLIQKMA